MRASAPRPRRTAVALLVAALLGTMLTAVLSTAPGNEAAAAPRKARPAKVKVLKVGSPRVKGDVATLTTRWSKSRNAKRYRVYVATNTAMRKAQRINLKGRKLVLRNLRPGVRYCVRVRGVSGRKLGKLSKRVCRTTPRLVRPARLWVTTQQLSSPTSSAITLNWPRTPGATSYELTWAPGGGNVLTDPQRSTLKVAARSTAVQTRVITGLRPGKVTCFQVRARSKYGVSTHSPQGCKFTMPASRAVPAASYRLDVATFNVCSSACTKAGRAWSARRVAVRDRILGMDVDVVAIQEGTRATSYLESADGLEGYVKGCQVGDGYGRDDDGGDPEASQWRNQSLFVRAATYTVVPGTADGIRFAAVNGLSEYHGVCWVELVHNATGQHVVVASVHLTHASGAVYDQGRYAQTEQLLAAIAAAYPPSTHPGGAPPVVMAGDFNSHRQAAYDGPRERFERNGFHDAFDVAARYESTPYQNSFNGWSEVPRTSTRWGNHLDKVVVPARAHVASWRIVEPMSGGRYSALLSDHSALRASVLLPR
ncbi:endonuclease/exonuclease/phosphatase family protein [Nocardioides sp. zg-536]|uniref:Endonuclease/exonuclease/phosphatase family protein n=1 Tax=Nocardioides faecalis TaxID=2803858 RepID=A0A939BUQ6_9ACTN|nr:fibronectin type III domain-containing protein [Nocardioides faecalis]MBM9458742.1 endonuclease/exonuclease/phosphatase family protein [Nocardioides faecalis]MBS4753077.1 endonuclease/exonuclease/phosphatase family protein [Nocardioides faecalis]QVI58726.1 endonuclease/exonuclease/phosphatase family protein [Nocardioides faecalis]